MTSPAFNRIVRGAVVGNVILMCLPYYGMSPVYETIIETLTAAITRFFASEMMLKLVALGCTLHPPA